MAVDVDAARVVKAARHDLGAAVSSRRGGENDDADEAEKKCASHLLTLTSRHRAGETQKQWAAFLIAGAVANAGWRMVESAETLAARRSAGTVAMLADGALILAAGLAVLVVCAVTSRQERRAERVAGGAPPAVTPVAAAEPSLGGSKSFPPPSAA